MTPQHRFRSIADELARLTAQREEAMFAAFAALERQHATLAVLLTLHLGDRQRAARTSAPSAGAPPTKRWPMVRSTACGIACLAATAVTRRRF